MCVMGMSQDKGWTNEGRDSEGYLKEPESPRRDERSIFQTIIGKDREEANREYDAAKEKETRDNSKK